MHTRILRNLYVKRTLLFSAICAIALSSFGGQSLFSQARELIQTSPSSSHRGTEGAAVVERVLDGDTVIVQGMKDRVRLANIDAPEMSHGYGRPGQPYSVQATRWMEKMVQGKRVTIRCLDEDRYGRRICDLFLNGEHVNKELVRAGLAWANTASARYLRDKSVLDAQREAQADRRGLWSADHAIPPWRWRHDCWENRSCTASR